MVSKTNICNISLRRLGCEPISSLSDNNKRARLYNDIYDIVIRNALEVFPWPFAKSRAVLTADPTAPVFGFKNRFKIPNDYILALKEFNDAEYLREGDYLLSDVAEMKLIYTKHVTNEDLFSPGFIKVAYLLLSIASCYALTNDKKLKNEIIAELDDAISDARVRASQESTPDQFEINSFSGPDTRGNFSFFEVTG